MLKRAAQNPYMPQIRRILAKAPKSIMEAMVLNSEKAEKSSRRGYSVAEVAQMYGVSRKTLYKLIRTGEINVMVGFGPWRVSSEEIARVSQRLLRNENPTEGKV